MVWCHVGRRSRGGTRVPECCVHTSGVTGPHTAAPDRLRASGLCYCGVVDHVKLMTSGHEGRTEQCPGDNVCCAGRLQMHELTSPTQLQQHFSRCHIPNVCIRDLERTVEHHSTVDRSPLTTTAVTITIRSIAGGRPGELLVLLQRKKSSKEVDVRICQVPHRAAGQICSTGTSAHRRRGRLRPRHRANTRLHLFGIRCLLMNQ